MAGTTRPTDPDAPEFAHDLSDAAIQGLDRSRRLAVPTGDDDDDALRVLRTTAIDLAVRFDLEVVLYDRSEETWMDHPHPAGPCDLDSIDREKRPHLIEQLDGFAARGVDASVWIATVPSLTEIVDVIRELDVDAVLVPEDGGTSKLLDKLKPGGPAEIVERVAALNLEVPIAVLVRHDDGTITVADSPAR